MGIDKLEKVSRVRNDNRRSSPHRGIGIDEPRVPSPDPVALSEPAKAPTVEEMFHKLAARDDGWLRAVPQDYGMVVYWKWKFVSGTHRGKYVMWREQSSSLCAGLSGLMSKLDEVDAGLRRPALDTPYGADEA